MKICAAFILFLTLVAASPAMDKPSFHPNGIPTGESTGPLKPGEYSWRPELPPQGPVVVLVRPGTTVIITEQPVVRKPVADSTYFAAN